MAWSLDVIFFLLLLLGCFIGAKVGLVRGVCKIAGWILSFVIPFICCVAFKDTLENWFGMVSAIGNGIGSMKVAGWLSIGISFVLLFFIVRLGTLLLAYWECWKPSLRCIFCSSSAAGCPPRACMRSLPTAPLSEPSTGPISWHICPFKSKIPVKCDGNYFFALKYENINVAQRIKFCTQCFT